MRAWIKFLLLAGFFALTIYATYYVATIRERICTTASVTSLWSGDRAYEATLLKKDCNHEETIFYSVRIDKPHEWFMIQDVEEDGYPTPAVQPHLKWSAHRLQIDIPARSLRGSYEHREGDLSVVRSWVTRPQGSD